MTLDELKLRHSALLAARYSGTRSVSYDGKTVNYGTDAELAAAIGDVERRIAKLERGADQIRALRRNKPVWAFVAEHAFSAGYALASQADRILLPRTGSVGSIGVVVMHADLSGQLDQDGVRVTLIHSGQHKVEGNPYEPLPENGR